MSQSASPAQAHPSLGAMNYTLTSDLAQFCLPAASQDTNRKFAWANSVCFLFLVIGLIGLKGPTIVSKQVEPVEELIPAIFEPPVQQAVNEPEPQPEETDSEQENLETPQVVTVVAADPSAAAFAVPVVGNVVLAPAYLASPPPVKAAPQPKPAPPPKPMVFRGGSDGYYPKPDYPGLAQRRGYQGTVMLDVLVDTNGVPTKVEVKESSNYSILDNAALDRVKIWKMPPGPPRHLYVPIDFQLK